MHENLERFRQSLTGSRVLVTGASGLIGTVLCRMLTGLGAEVTGSSRSGRCPAGLAVAKWRSADLADAEAVRALVEEAAPTIIFNLAGAVRGDRTTEAIQPTLAANFVGTVNLLAAAQAVGVSRFVCTGSLQEPLSADDTPCSPYAASKWAANAYARMYEGLFNLDVVIARLYMVYGPEQSDASKLVPYVVHKFLANEAPSLTSGVYEADWIYVDDVVRGMIAAGCVPEARGRTFEFGTGKMSSVREVVLAIKDILQTELEPQFGKTADRPREAVRSASLAASQNTLGWQAEVGLREGLKKTVASYRTALLAKQRSLAEAIKMVTLWLVGDVITADAPFALMCAASTI